MSTTQQDRSGLTDAAGAGPGSVVTGEVTRREQRDRNRDERRGSTSRRRWALRPVWRSRRKAKATKAADGAFGPEEDQPAEDTPVEGEQAEQLLMLADLVPTQQGPSNRPNGRKASRGFYAPRTDGALSTTRQAQILNPAVLASPTDEEGIVVGRDTLTNSAVAHDQFTAYRNKVITSPHVVVLGVIGAGKSSLIKTVYVLRPLILKNRRAVVLDRKDEQGEGEYAELTRRFGSEPYRFQIGGGGTRISPLDPRIRAKIGAAGQLRLLGAMAEATMQGSTTRDPAWEGRNMRVAFTETLRRAEAQGRAPVIDDLVPMLGNIDLLDTQTRQSMSAAALERMHQAGLTLRWAMEETLAEALDGLFNGETSANVNLNDRLTTFDISQLPYDGPATSLVLGVVHSWLLGTLRKERGMGTNFIVEEGWDMMTGPVAKQMNANQYLARGLGLANIAAMHHVAQAANSTDGMALLREPQTVHLYRQDRMDDVEAIVSTYGLDAMSRDVLLNLPQGQHLMKIGNRPEVRVEHTRSALEIELTNTDTAMNAGAGTMDQAAA